MCWYSRRKSTIKAEENRGLTELKTLEVTSEVYDESQLKTRHPKERIIYEPRRVHTVSYFKKSDNPSIGARNRCTKQKILCSKDTMDANNGVRGEPFLSQAYEKISQQLIVTQPKSALAGGSGNV